MRFITKTTIVVLYTVLTSGCESSMVNIAAETEAVRERSVAIAAAEAAKEIETVLTFWADDAIMQFYGAPQINGKDAVSESVKGYFAYVKEFKGTSSHIEVSAAGDLAYEFGVNRVILPGPTGDLLAMGKYLFIWKKIDGAWYLSALSVTDDTPSPVAMEGQ